MPQTLTFPELGLEFVLNRVAFSIGGWAIYWYGIIIAISFLAGSFYAFKRSRTFGLDSDYVFDVVLAGIIMGIVGARLYYVAFTWTEFDSFIDIISTRSGGLAIYGGLMGAMLATFIACKIRRVKLVPMLDLACGGIILGQAIGRWANFVNIEAFGSNTTLPWGMHGPAIEHFLRANQSRLTALGMSVDPAQPVHPAFLYESLWCLLGFFFILWLTKRRRFDGQISLVYLIWYGIGRFFIEGLRTDSLLLGNVRISQIVALLCVVVAGLALIIISSKIRRENDPEYMKLYVNTEEGQLILAGKFYEKKKKGKDKAQNESESEDDAASDADSESDDEEDVSENDAPKAEDEDESADEDDSESVEESTTEDESADEDDSESVDESTSEDESDPESEPESEDYAETDSEKQKDE